MSCPRVPLRWVLGIFGFYACAFISMQRATVSVSIVHMTSPKFATSTANTARATINTTLTTRTSKLSDECYPDHLKFNQSDQVARTVIDEQLGAAEFDWSEELQGIILGASFYLYCVFPPIAGRLTDAFGGKWVCFVGVTCSGLVSLSIPTAVRLGGSTALICLQVLLGSFLALIYPSVYNLIVRWFPTTEKANANAGMIFGGCVGTTFGSFMSGELCNRFGWPSVFYAAAFVHVPWMIVWSLLVTNDPLDNRWISDQELSLIVDKRLKTRQLSVSGNIGKIFVILNIAQS